MMKKGGHALTLTKISSEISFLSVNWVIPEKKIGVEHILF